MEACKASLIIIVNNKTTTQMQFLAGSAEEKLFKIQLTLALSLMRSIKPIKTTMGHSRRMLRLSPTQSKVLKRAVSKKQRMSP